MINISLSGGTDADLLSLYGWLGSDPDVRRAARLTMGSPVASGTMGSLEVINAVMTQALAVSQLALAYVAWRTSRGGAPPMQVTINNVSIAVTDASAETVAQLERLVESGHEAGRPAGDASHA